MLTVSNGDAIWVLTFHGPASATFHGLLPPLEKDDSITDRYRETAKVLVCIGGSFELKNVKECFADERACCSAAAANEQAKAMRAMQLAAKWSARACGQPDPND